MTAKLVVRIGFSLSAFLIRMRLSARVFRRLLVRAGIPPADAETLYRAYKGPGLISLLKRIDLCPSVGKGRGISIFS